VIISSFFFRILSPLAAKKPRRPVLNLYVDGQLVYLKPSELDVPRDQDLAEPTYIGQDARGRFPFIGRLSPPRIYNQAMSKHSNASFPGIESVHERVCPTS